MGTPPTHITTQLQMLFNSNTSMAIVAMVTVVFVNNTYHAIRLLSNNRKPMYILNLLQSLLGAITNITMIITFFYYDEFCGVRVYFAAMLNLISTCSIELILLSKAYYGSTKARTVLFCGVLCESIRIAAGLLNLAQMEPITTSLHTCDTKVSPLGAISVVTTELLVNGFFSIFFLTRIYNLWKFTPTRLYVTLLTDGTIYCLCTASVSVLMVVLAMTNILNEQSSILFNVSWVTASKLTSEQLIHTHKLKISNQLSRKETEPSSYNQSSGQLSNPSHSQANKLESSNSWADHSSKKATTDEVSVEIDPMEEQLQVRYICTGLTPPPRPSSISKEWKV